MPTTTNDTATLARKLQDTIASGDILGAMSKFYAENVKMQENANPPVEGLETNIEREKEFLAQVKEFKGYEVKALGVDGDTALIECVLEFINTDDQPVRLEQVSVQRWEGGKVVHERFYYDASAK